MAQGRVFLLHTGVFVLAVTAAALMLSVLMRPLLEPGCLPFFLLAVVLSAWFHGPAGGYSATIVSSILLIYFFLIPAFDLNASTGNNLIRLVIFVSVSVLITWLTSAWRTSQGMLKATLSSTGDAVMATDGEGRITFLNPVAAELTGRSWPGAKGEPARDVLTLIQERTAEPVTNAIDRVLSEQMVIKNERHVLLVVKEGNPVPIEQSAAPIRDRDGRLRGAILVFRDITGRRQIEEQTTQTQKMDAVGRLAGSVAGDFNNALTVITGYSELLQAELPANSQMRRFAEEITWAAERAAGLTGQLLAFSRGSSAPLRRLDLNSLVGGMEAMLRRLLGETIEFIFLPGPGLGRVDADPSQIEQVITNLLINSKEAMPKGGKVVIETSNVDLRDPVNSQRVGVKPGEYVMLAVSDTGIGMDAEMRTQLFEPFFTTKDRGKGSGLGLSIVYGILRQYEGHITVYSQPGCGTIFEVYLPVAQEQGVLPRKRERSPKGSETILLVDDEEGVLKLVSAILQSNGYQVIEANNGVTALSAYEKNAHKIDMLLSDVVMPQMNGFQLGEELSRKKPELKILYMSGYRDSPIGAPPGQATRALLHKPFTPEILLAKVRDVLDARVS